MAFCSNCGTQVNEGVKFCPSCGKPVGAAPANQPSATPEAGQRQEYGQQPSADNRLANAMNTADTTAQFTPADVEKNKGMAVLAYLGILVLIPILAAKDSPFARYHANQGLILCLAAIIYGVAMSVLVGVILAISWRLYFLVTILRLVGIVFAVLCVIGIINAVNGKAKELPLIGKYRLLK